jgi:LEA14-like dessication related protein
MKNRLIGILIAVLIGAVLILMNREELQLASQSPFLLKQINGTGYELQSQLKLYNPNLLSSTVQEIHETFKLNGTTAAILNMQVEQGIAGRKETSFPVMVRFDKATFEKVFPDSVLTGTEVPVEITGEITYKNFTVSGVVNVSIKDKAHINLKAE